MVSAAQGQALLVGESREVVRMHALHDESDERATFMKKYRAKLAVAYGIVQKDFVAVPPAMLGRTALLKPYLAISRAYAERLGMKKGAKR